MFIPFRYSRIPNLAISCPLHAFFSKLEVMCNTSMQIREFLWRHLIENNRLVLFVKNAHGVIKVIYIGYNVVFHVRSLLVGG